MNNTTLLYLSMLVPTTLLAISAVRAFTELYTTIKAESELLERLRHDPEFGGLLPGQVDATHLVVDQLSKHISKLGARERFALEDMLNNASRVQQRLYINKLLHRLRPRSSDHLVTH